MCPRAAWPNGLQGGATHVTSAFLREGVPIWSIRALTLTRTRIRTYSPHPVTSLYPPAACTFCSAIARLIRCCLPHSWTDHKEGGCGCVSVCLGGHVWSATHSCNRLQGQGAPLHTHTHARTHTHTHTQLRLRSRVRAVGSDFLLCTHVQVSVTRGHWPYPAGRSDVTAVHVWFVFVRKILDFRNWIWLKVNSSELGFFFSKQHKLQLSLGKL